MSDSFHLEFLIDPDQYALTVQHQRERAREIADRLERNEPLDGMLNAGPFAAAILRLWADKLPSKQPRKRGQAPQIDASNVALQYEAMVRLNNKSKNAAKEELAEAHGVSVEAIRKALRKKGGDAKRFMDSAEQYGTVYPNLKK